MIAATVLHMVGVSLLAFAAGWILVIALARSAARGDQMLESALDRETFHVIEFLRYVESPWTLSDQLDFVGRRGDEKRELAELKYSYRSRLAEYEAARSNIRHLQTVEDFKEEA